VSRTLWNRPLDWGEAELHFPGCSAAWDLVISVMNQIPEDPRLMAVWSFDHVPCPDPEWCRVCQVPGNVLQLTAKIGEHTRLTYDKETERWAFTGSRTY
jgi:hypothetical protein